MKTVAIAEIARDKRVTRQAIEAFRDANGIKPAGKSGRVDLYHVSDFANFGKPRKEKSEWRELYEKERAVKLQLDNRKKRGELIDRALVAQAFGEMYSIDRGVLLQIGPGLSDTIVAVCDAGGADRTLKIQKLIDGEIYNALAAVKATINKFFRRIEAVEIKDALPEPKPAARKKERPRAHE